MGFSRVAGRVGYGRVQCEKESQGEVAKDEV